GTRRLGSTELSGGTNVFARKKRLTSAPSLRSQRKIVKSWIIVGSRLEPTCTRAPARCAKPDYPRTSLCRCACARPPLPTSHPGQCSAPALRGASPSIAAHPRAHPPSRSIPPRPSDHGPLGGVNLKGSGVDYYRVLALRPYRPSPGAATGPPLFRQERRTLSVFARFSRLCARLKVLKRLQLRTDLEGCSSG